MRIFAIYFCWLSMWFTSVHYYNMKDLAIWKATHLGLTDCELSTFVSNEVKTEVEASRCALYLAVAIFAILAADKKQRSLSYQVQIEHIAVIIGAKALDHCFALAACFGYATEIDPYTFSIVNYILAGLFVICTPFRIWLLKRQAKWKG